MKGDRDDSRFRGFFSMAATGLGGPASGLLVETAEKSKALFGDRLLDKVFPECPVPALMLPTGPSPDDYALLFRLDEMLDNLQSGILVRPKIHVWAARKSGHDIQRFGEEFKQGFVSQFNDARDSLLDEGQSELDKLEQRRQRLADEIAAEASGPTLKSATRWGALAVVWLPLVLLGLAFGFRPRTELINLLRNYWAARGDKKQAERELNRELRELESRFDEKDKAFQRAVRNIEIRVHPRIHNLVASVCDAAGVAFFDDGSEPERGDVPDIDPYLRDPRYAERVPYRYQWLLTVKPSS